MEKNNKYTFSVKNVKNISFDNYDQNFTFIVNGHQYRTSRIQADLLSPIINRYHNTDPINEEFIINTNERNDPQDNTDYFSDFLKITTFNEYEINEQQREHFIEYFSQLGNIKEYLGLHPTYFENLTPENVIERLKYFENKPETIIENENMNQMIEYASIHFEEIDKETLKTLCLEFLELIIKNRKLKLDDEDSLIEFILELYKIDTKYSILFEYVYFTNLNNSSIEKFINEFDINFLNTNIWHQICQRLISSNEEYINNEYFIKERYNSKYVIREHEEGKEFNGLLRYLNETTGGNIHDNGTIEITSNSIYHDNYHPKYLLDYQNTENNYYQSKSNISNAYICFDFKNRNIQLSSYTIKTLDAGPNNFHLKNWNIEVSNDKEHWNQIDEHKNDSTLNGSRIIKTFNIQQPSNFYRYVRLHQTGPNWENDYYIIFYSLEMYGKLSKPESKLNQTK